MNSKYSSLFYRMSFSLTAVPAPLSPLLKGRSQDKKVGKVRLASLETVARRLSLLSLRRNKGPRSPCPLLEIGRAWGGPRAALADGEREVIKTLPQMGSQLRYGPA